MRSCVCEGRMVQRQSRLERVGSGFQNYWVTSTFPARKSYSVVCGDRPCPTFLQRGLFTAPSVFSLASCSIVSKFSWVFMSLMTPSLFFFTLPYLFSETVWPLGGKTLCAVERATGEEARGLGAGRVVTLISCETEGSHLPQPPFPDMWSRRSPGPAI